MEESYKNDALIELTNDSYYIHDATVSRFDIYLQNHQLCIDVYFHSILPKITKTLKIHFSNVIKYQFLYTLEYSFYNVERYKFFKTENGYYISLDPYDESAQVSEKDGDLILCETIEGTFI